MKQTRLYDRHVELGGRMVPFADYELPVQYTAGPNAEHRSVRTAAGVFDIDHMGQFALSGEDALAYLQYVQVADVASLDEWEARYSLLCYDDGTIVDDIFIYRLPEKWLIVVNAANREKDFTWLQSFTHGYRVELTDISDETYMLAVQGPRAAAILDRMSAADLAAAPARTALQAEVGGVDMLLGRTGYTGEDGFELYLPPDKAVSFWDSLLAEGARDGLLPCGLAARDSLRFEACMSLYGHEIDAKTNPYEARLGWVVALQKPSFLGRNALLKVKLEGTERFLVGFEMIEKAVPREDHGIIGLEGQVVGHVTTGMKSPTLDKFVGLGYLPRGMTRIGSEIHILIRGRPRRARICKRPFYRRVDDTTGSTSARRRKGLFRPFNSGS
ncbi:MAG: glycine cleavage system aminomethyltransferase GcvT [Caldilineaceae bacterium]|nr:glycine cleavage system aminomethyltransferase GcvT [Caldilineaceae bacterium]